jgi:peptidoglycan/LPS O-acetylase OafA/YrhL
MLTYRPEIDGLRALAVLPVILFHADFDLLNGGFIGVDIFFVISGYLITSIILLDLRADAFSLSNFYERRARRVLPALFFIMLACSIAGYELLMPDEFKNFGQSLVAASLFSNNILLAVTSDYWELASEFKPLLHTWSLGVEEQYYLFFPAMLLLLWRIGKISIPYVIALLTIGSFVLANWLVLRQPDWAFYSLPTRLWELGVGSLVALHLEGRRVEAINAVAAEYLSFVGLILIISSFFYFENDTPVFLMLIPILGVVLIILYCLPGNYSHRILSNRLLVYIGLVSYSLYLWHQPVFSYLRASSTDRPGHLEFALAVLLIVFLSIVTWRFVEQPFRDSRKVSTKNFRQFAVFFTIFFIAIGAYLDQTYGMATRVFGKQVSIDSIDKRIYNQRAFEYKKDAFSEDNKSKILIVGNSFARDFVNLTLETFDISRVEIIYRDDLRHCIEDKSNGVGKKLFFEANVIVFASGRYQECYQLDLAFAQRSGKKIFYVGPKNFGYNLNWLIQLDPSLRRNQYNRVPDHFARRDQEMRRVLPRESFISLIEPVLSDGKIPVTDEDGYILSADREHFTRYGAIYFGKKAVLSTHYSDFFR